MTFWPRSVTRFPQFRQCHQPDPVRVQPIAMPWVVLDHSVEWRQGITRGLRQLRYRFPAKEDASSERCIGSALSCVTN